MNFNSLDLSLAIIYHYYCNYRNSLTCPVDDFVFFLQLTANSLDQQWAVTSPYNIDKNAALHILSKIKILLMVKKVDITSQSIKYLTRGKGKAKSMYNNSYYYYDCYYYYNNIIELLYVLHVKSTQ